MILDCTQGETFILANIRHQLRAGLLLAQRLRRRPNIKPALGRCHMFADMVFSRMAGGDFLMSPYTQRHFLIDSLQCLVWNDKIMYKHSVH